jgi:transcription termination factor Rho
VSVDSIDLDGLERKDRAELATIAQALGGKPGSRAKKADIITMILELAGVTPPSAEADRAGDEPSAGADDDGDHGTDDHDTDGPIPSDPPRADAGPIPSEQPAAGDALVPEARRSAAPQHSGDHDDTEVDNGQGQPQGGDQPAEGEGGRRRRRRRGRDRDRNDEGGEGQNWEGEPIEVAGILDLRDEGYGFLRVDGLLPSRDDVYVSVKQTRQFGLRRGDWLTGASRPANRGEKNPALLRIDTVNGTDPERSRERPRFEDLTPLFPQERVRL